MATSTIRRSNGGWLLYLFGFLFLLSPSFAEKTTTTTNPTVTIASGTVIGTATGVLNQPTVKGLANAYLGVPFASSPPLRFAPPTAPKPWSTPLVAHTLPPACLQQFANGSVGEKEKAYFNNPGYPPPPESEDCLYLNVFAPQDAGPAKLKSVMFFLFGGDLQIGTASLATYNGSSLAVNEDVVVVVPNYRTNIFGFSNSPEIPVGQQNSGLLDQRFALQWVQDNIRAFGGDPTQVTIFGESAGAYSVKQLLANPPSPLPFRAAILESQQTSVPGNGSENYDKVLRKFACADAPSPIGCLRKVPGTDIQAYITDNNIGFPPVEGDGTYMASKTLPSIKSGRFADVPILIGTNADEFQVFLAMTGTGNGSDVVGSVLSLTGLDISLIKDSLLASYAASSVDGGIDVASQIATDIAFTCTTRTFANAIVAARRQPVWRYRYSASFPDLSFFPNAGAYHSSEIPSAWGTYPLANAWGIATPTQVALSEYMQGVWAGFAKDPSAGPGWPKLGSARGKELGELGNPQKNARGGKTIQLNKADHACALLDPLNIASGKAY